MIDNFPIWFLEYCSFIRGDVEIDNMFDHSTLLVYTYVVLRLNFEYFERFIDFFLNAVLKIKNLRLHFPDFYF